MILTTLRQKAYYRWFVLFNVSIGTFMSTMDASSVNVALPTIADQFQVPLTTVQWIVTAYLLVISCLLLTFGRLADIIGKTKVFSFGFLVFALGSTLCFFSQSINQLIGARIVEGFGAAMLMSTSMGIITELFPPQERGRALGSLGTVVAAGSMAGPSLGGFLVGAFGWEYIFMLNIFIGFVALMFSLYVLPKDQLLKTQQRFDYLGAGLFAGSMALFILGLSFGGRKGWLSGDTLLMLTTAVILFGLFLIIEKKVADPLLDLKLFTNRQFSAGNLAGMLSFVAMFSTTVIITFFMQNVLLYSPQQVGLMMMSFPVMMAFTSPLSGFLSDRIGPVFLTSAGMGINVLALFGLSRIIITTAPWVIVLLLALIGIGMALFQSPNNSCVMGTVPPQKLGISGGVVATVRNIGMVVGIALSVSLFNGRYQQLLSQATNPAKVDTKLLFVHSQTFVFEVASFICFLALLSSTIRGGSQHKTQAPVIQLEQQPTYKERL